LDETGEVRIEREMPVAPTGKTTGGKQAGKEIKPPRFFLFGVNRGRVEQVAKEMQLSLAMVDSLSEANLFVTSKKYYRQKPQKVKDAEAANLPIYVLKSNTPPQIRQLLNAIYPVEAPTVEIPARESPFKHALDEATEAVEQVKSGAETVELSPQSAYIRRLQHLIAERNALLSQSTGKDPNRRVRIYRE